MGPEEVIEPRKLNHLYIVRGHQFKYLYKTLDRRGTTSESEGRALSAPNLADIKLKVTIP